MLRDKLIGRWSLPFLAVALLGAMIPLTSSRAAEDALDRGPALGSKAPEFNLHDQSDQPRTLGQLRGKGIAALVFYRSADW